ncbi:peroxisome assembly protein 26 [Patella vulgata]|uniref:peroxisome assembly protein 26 n=1 Tax=Patella vulgata TaxID=6465 RepID=UPI00217F4864|nr:peroxisome assembly protein 26 [Patella vulgata]
MANREYCIISDFRADIESATDFLISKQFLRCIELCNTIIYRGKETGLILSDVQNSSLRSSVELEQIRDSDIGAPVRGSSLLLKDSEQLVDHVEEFSTPKCPDGTDAVVENRDWESKLCGLVNSAVVLSIQAYAELNQWNDVIPFIRRVYDDVENCPPKVIHMCLLLYAKVKEYIQCHALAKIWLQCPKNYKLSEYKDVAEVYVTKILMSTHRFDMIPKVINNCGGLTSREKEEMLDNFKKSEKIETSAQTQLVSTDHSESHLPNEENSGIVNSTGLTGVSDDLISYGSTLLKKLFRTLSRERIKKIWKVILMTAVAIFAFLHTQYGDFTTNLNRAMVVWEGVLKVFRSMFGNDQP